MPGHEQPKRIPKIERRNLPAKLPRLEAMKSCGHNEHNYHPDMWDLEYITYRYLSRVADDRLRNRYSVILRNMGSYIDDEQDLIPINSYYSSWYWFRKEHHTRLEFAMRKIALPPFTFRPSISKGPVSIPWPIPNGTKALFRYGKRKYMQEMVEEGRVRFVPAETYSRDENNAARRDEELQKHAYMAGEYTTVTTLDGKSIPVIGDIQRTISGPNYHLVCFSCVWNEQLFDDFEADTCVVVTAPQELARRLESAGMATFPGWYFHYNPVQYFDPYQQSENEYFDAGMSKDFLFAYQYEYRFLWAQINAASIYGAQFVNIGPSQDIMNMYDKAGNKISA